MHLVKLVLVTYYSECVGFFTHILTKHLKM